MGHFTQICLMLHEIYHLIPF